MKVALMTIWHEKNFGAEMQCYATVKALRKLGHEVEVIDFRLSDMPNLSLKARIARFIAGLSPESKSFRDFWNKYIPSGFHYKTFRQLQERPPVADIFLSGSDQVWNLNITKDKWRAYFLDFGEKDTRKFSYASSIGEDRWIWQDKRDSVRKLLDSFRSISIREYTGKVILNQEFGMESTHVLDPTLLHGGYDEIVKPEKSNNSVVYYPLTFNPELDAFSRKLASRLRFGWIDTNSSTKLLGKITWRRTSIVDWIRNIAEAELVVTPSFHGLAFSLIYHKQFIIVQNAKKDLRSSRIQNLLSSLGLEYRYFSSIEEVESSDVLDKPIDYSIVGPKLEKLRQESWNFLKRITEA